MHLLNLHATPTWCTDILFFQYLYLKHPLLFWIENKNAVELQERLSALTDLMSSELEFLWKDLPQEKIVPDDLSEWNQSFPHLKIIFENICYEQNKY